MKRSRTNKFVRTSSKLLEPVDKSVLPGHAEHVTGEYATTNTHDLFGILPEPEKYEKEDIPCGNSQSSSMDSR
jgi:hypothetical protein